MIIKIKQKMPLSFLIFCTKLVLMVLHCSVLHGVVRCFPFRLTFDQWDNAVQHTVWYNKKWTSRVYAPESRPHKESCMKSKIEILLTKLDILRKFCFWNFWNSFCKIQDLVKSWDFDSLLILQPESTPYKEVCKRLEIKIWNVKLDILDNFSFW